MAILLEGARTLSGIQKFLQMILPKEWSADMEAESRGWKLRCPSCGLECSIWDLGGVRWKAEGNPRRLARCRNCGRKGWHEIRRQGGGRR